MPKQTMARYIEEWFGNVNGTSVSRSVDEVPTRVWRHRLDNRHSQ